MDWLERMNDVLEYIEYNLEGIPDYNEIAKKACCSKYHFSRMFSSITGISLCEYIRRRKLSLAAFDLQKGEQKIIDIAMKYGYDSPDSFSRAFKNIHGVIPSEVKKNGIQLKAFPKLSFQINIKGGAEMDYRIEKLDFQFSIVGVRKRVKTKNAFKEIPKLWDEAKRSGFTKRLIDMSWENPECKLESLLGICGEEAAIKDEEFDYFIGVRYEKAVPEDMEKIVISDSMWVVFPNIVEAWKRLYNEWIPTSNYDLADLPCIECFYSPGHKPKNELWVPVRDI